jgi:hypothetical protein
VKAEENWAWQGPPPLQIIVAAILIAAIIFALPPLFWAWDWWSAFWAAK